MKNGYFPISNNFIDKMQLLSGAAVKVYLIIAKCSKMDAKNNKSFPSYEYIKDNSGLSTASIAKGIRELKENNLVSVSRRFDNSNVYILAEN